MNFEFGKTTEVTALAISVNPEYSRSGYTRIFLCADVNDVHLLRVLPGFGEDYERDENAVIVECNEIPNDYKHQALTRQMAQEILKNDDMDNYSYHVFYTMNAAIWSIDQGFGISSIQPA